MPYPTQDTSRLNNVLGVYSVSISTSAVQVNGSIINAQNGQLVNGTLAALGAAPPYLCRLVEISNPTAQLYIGRTSSVSSSNFNEEMAANQTTPVTIQCGGSVPIWLVATGSGTVTVTFYN